MSARIALLTAMVFGLALVLSGCPQKTDTGVAKIETAPESLPTPPSEDEAAKAETEASDEAEATKTEPAAPSGEEAAKSEPAPAGDAGSLLQDRCTQCHGIDRVEKEKADAEEWGKIVKRMQGHAVKKQKTPIADDEAKQILEHILATYGQ
ncbi:MAG: hypothetical protein FJX74_01460 [Armatimonadetes bacterium]|nr:hypothetical protein [Armatimonadota bacterium]